ncbi:MAG: thiamine biosynthesis protein ApbE [Chloroflexi bacterium RBG_13_51_18]|nr:MAG: thiamine biosynthesis protein ApbE [Chloroflexi bacterium RBG_13_51_18]
MKEDTFQPKEYRHWVEGKDLTEFTVKVKETDLYIRATSNLERKAYRITLKYRQQLERYIEQNPDFQSSLKPLPTPERAPRIVVDMIEAGQKANVGPMAAVAGAVAEYVGRELLKFSPEVIVENGGDIFLKITRKRVVGIFAGDSPLTGKLGMEINPQDTPMGVCTSSGTVGHSLSYGKADAVVVTAGSAILADAAATAICNKVSKPDDINDAIEFGQNIGGLRGIVIILGGNIGVWGEIKLCET